MRCAGMARAYKSQHSMGSTSLNERAFVRSSGFLWPMQTRRKCSRAMHRSRTNAQRRFIHGTGDVPVTTVKPLQPSIYEACSQRNKTGTQPA